MFCNCLLLFPFWARKFIFSVTCAMITMHSCCADTRAMRFCQHINVWEQIIQIVPTTLDWLCVHFTSENVLSSWLKISILSEWDWRTLGRCETMLIFFKNSPIYASHIWRRMQGNSFLGLAKSLGSVSNGNAKSWLSDCESQESSRMSNTLRTQNSTI